jgi:hypothetical protein
LKILGIAMEIGIQLLLFIHQPSKSPILFNPNQVSKGIGQLERYRAVLEKHFGESFNMFLAFY